MNTPELFTVERAEKHSPAWLLSAARVLPQRRARFGVQIFHSFSDHKERWFPFMRFIAACGGVAVIHDLRGHGDTAAAPTDPKQADVPADFGYAYETLFDDADAVWQASGAADPETGEPLPRFLFGHGMGALIAGLYAAHNPGNAAGVILSGLPKRERAVSFALGWLAFLSLFTGDAGKPPLLNRRAFARYNRGFEPEAASDGRYLWMTNDLAVRYAFAADEKCARSHPLRDYRNLLRLTRDFWRPSSWEKPGPVPVLLLAGERDPIAGGDRGTVDAAAFLGDMGFPAPETRMYRGMRHAIFMDTEREAPFTDALRFVLNRIPKRPAPKPVPDAPAESPRTEETAEEGEGNP